jgi:hypothetical protein
VELSATFNYQCAEAFVWDIYSRFISRTIEVPFRNDSRRKKTFIRNIDCYPNCRGTQPKSPKLPPRVVSNDIVLNRTLQSLVTFIVACLSLPLPYSCHLELCLFKLISDDVRCLTKQEKGPKESVGSSIVSLLG